MCTSGPAFAVDSLSVCRTSSLRFLQVTSTMAGTSRLAASEMVALPEVVVASPLART